MKEHPSPSQLKVMSFIVRMRLLLFHSINLIGNQTFDALRKELKGKMREWIEFSKDKGLERDSDAEGEAKKEKRVK